jgi:glycine/D-amino acid oxidase-like deaminating enzyme
MQQLHLPESLWTATAQPGPATAALSESIKVDVAIIGAGFNGLRAALVLAEAGTNVAVVDSGEVGWGASGRNGGQVNPIGHETPEVIANQWSKRHGTDYTQRYCRFTIDSADELFSLVKKYKIECDAEQNGWIRAVHGDAAMLEFEKMQQGWQAAGADLKLIDAAELGRLSGASGYKMGWFASRGGSVQPLSYVRGLASAALQAGAAIYSHTAINNLQYHSGKWVLTSGQGVISADQVLLCTNGYTDRLYSGLRETIVPVVSIQAATQPLTAEQDRQILSHRNTFSDTRRVIYYFRKTADNRLVFGSAGTNDDQPGSAERHRILLGLKTVFPQFSGFKLDYIWGGKVAVTQDHLPHIHQPAPGLHTALGCNGRGVALSTATGRLLAELVLGKNKQDLPIPVSEFKKYPFHRFHRLGIKIAVGWKEYQDKREAAAKKF